MLLYLKKEEVPDGEWTVSIGKADIKREGSDITVVAISNAVHKTIEAPQIISKDISVEVVDPRTLDPLDIDTITESVKKTHCLLIVQEGGVKAGFGSEVVRQVCETGFKYMKAPPLVLGGSDVPVPFSPVLENAYVPGVEDIIDTIKLMLGRTDF